MAFSDWDAVLSTTLKNYVPKLVDNVFSARPLVYFLKQAGQIRQISGGAKIVIPLIYAQSTAAGSYATTDALSTTAQTGISAAEYDWRQFYATVTINGLEEAQNNGEAQIIDLLEAKIMQAEETITEILDLQFFGDGTGNSGKDWLGLKALLYDNSPAFGTATVGGIDGSAQSFWRSTAEATAAALTIAYMATAYNTVSVGNDQPNVILTTQTLYEKYETLLQPQMRFADSKTADAGFQNLMYKGAPVVYDVNCDAGYMYFLNTKYLRLVGHSDVWFKPTPFVRPNDKDARYAQILCYGNLVTSNRKRQAVLTGKT
jgi:hypothetical protein